MNASVDRLTYLDASAICRFADARVAAAVRRYQLIAPHIQAIFDDETREIACSEVTLIEFHSYLTAQWRGSGIVGYDEAWWTDCRNDIYGRIADGRISVLPTPSDIVESAMSLVTTGTRFFHQPVNSWDAIHMLMASRWADSRGVEVEVITSDKHFRFVDTFSGFAGSVSVLNLDLVAKTGEGADKGSAGC